MWIKIGHERINLEHIIKYVAYDTADGYEGRKLYIQYKSDANITHVFTKGRAIKVCEYIDNLIISGKYKEVGMLVIDSEFEEKIKDIEFKTLEEFKG